MHFPALELKDMPEDIRERILAVKEQPGFTPNVFLALAHRPDEFRAFFAYHDALMEKPGNLTKAEREMIVVATSSANQCQFCDENEKDRSDDRPFFLTLGRQSHQRWHVNPA